MRRAVNNGEARSRSKVLSEEGLKTLMSIISGETPVFVQLQVWRQSSRGTIVDLADEQERGIAQLLLASVHFVADSCSSGQAVRARLVLLGALPTLSGLLSRLSILQPSTLSSSELELFLPSLSAISSLLDTRHGQKEAPRCEGLGRLLVKLCGSSATRKAIREIAARTLSSMVAASCGHRELASTDAVEALALQCEESCPLELKGRVLRAAGTLL
eukprot:121199-Rhodomonas_salina.1